MQRIGHRHNHVMLYLTRKPSCPMEASRLTLVYMELINAILRVENYWQLIPLTRISSGG